MFVKLILCVGIFVGHTRGSLSVDNLLYTHNKFDFKTEITNKLPDLVAYVAENYMSDCVPYLLYDDFFYETYVYKDMLLQTMEKLGSVTRIHGFLDRFNITESVDTRRGRRFCFHYIIFSNDEDAVVNRLDFLLTSKVVFITTMSKYQLSEFLQSPGARNVLNLLIISDPILQREDYKVRIVSKDINLYTHKLHVDGIGSSSMKILTSWRKNNLTRPYVDLFPPKLNEGFNGHQLLIIAFEQPPFVFRKKRGTSNSDDLSTWDGVEVRLLRLVAESLNLGLSVRDTETEEESKGGDEIVTAIAKGKADIGISGIYITRRYYEQIYFSTPYSQDCAVFITLSSTAIPKYRAILGPFQWPVWIFIISIYMAAIIPIAFSEKLSCKEMFEDCNEVGTMLWMVFGTFTNLFAYRADQSWNNSKKNSTCMMIGTYWVFTIIITAAYSSSIISFITIPTYFEVVDNANDLLEEEYRVGVLDARDWKTWFNDTSDYKTNKLLKHVDVVNATGIALHKVLKDEKYAFLGSENALSYIVRSNYTMSEKKKSMFHIASQCVAPFMVSFAMKQKTDFLLKVDQQIQKFLENGIINKIRRDIDWDVSRKSKTKLFTASAATLRADTVEDRQLTVDDMQGMFLLLGIGVTFAGASLIRECWLGFQCCGMIKARSARTGKSIPSIKLTPCEDNDRQVPAVVRKFSAVCGRAVSASMTVGDYLTDTFNSNVRRFSH